METGKRISFKIGVLVSIVFLMVGFVSVGELWAADATTTLSWDKNAEPDVQYYRLYTGASVQEVVDKTNPGENIIGPATPDSLPDRIVAPPKTITVADNFEGVIYYGVTAVDTSGNESDIVAEGVVGVPFDFLAPSPVRNLLAE